MLFYPPPVWPSGQHYGTLVCSFCSEPPCTTLTDVWVHKNSPFSLTLACFHTCGPTTVIDAPVCPNMPHYVTLTSTKGGRRSCRARSQRTCCSDSQEYRQWLDLQSESCPREGVALHRKGDNLFKWLHWAGPHNSRCCLCSSAFLGRAQGSVEHWDTPAYHRGNPKMTGCCIGSMRHCLLSFILSLL